MNQKGKKITRVTYTCELRTYHVAVQLRRVFFRCKFNNTNFASCKIITKNSTLKFISEGPIVDALNNQGEMWVFGKDVRGNEVYIKITLGKPNSHTICISFHRAEHPMSYPLKNKGDGKQ